MSDLFKKKSQGRDHPKPLVLTSPHTCKLICHEVLIYGRQAKEKNSDCKTLIELQLPVELYVFFFFALQKATLIQDQVYTTFFQMTTCQPVKCESFPLFHRYELIAGKRLFQCPAWSAYLNFHPDNQRRFSKKEVQIHTC